MPQKEEKRQKVGIRCEVCKSKRVYYTGKSYSQESDASRNMPMVEVDEIYCDACSYSWLW